MKIGIPKERRIGERRIAATPDVVKKLINIGAEVSVESGAGEFASVSDDSMRHVGANILDSSAAIYENAEIILKVQRPIDIEEGGLDEMSMLREGMILIGLLSPLFNRSQVEDYAKRGVTAFSMDLIPRISRAQSMDVLSSQSNIAGYKAVIEAANTFGRIFPMMMTAAGTISPTKVLILGAGVAGLQSIATAKRLGAVVSAFDVRPVVKEQVQSLGAKFIEVDSDKDSQSETSGGYAQEMGDDYKLRQQKILGEVIKAQDICITTAQIPGRKAPVLITEKMVNSMKDGSVIVDLSVETGGNCALSAPDKVIDVGGVKIIGHSNWPSLIPAATSSLYGKNLMHFLNLLIDKQSKKLSIDWEDEIIRGALLTRDGAQVNSLLDSMEL